MQTAYDKVLEDRRRLTRELDEAINGEGNASLEPARLLRADHVNLLRFILDEPDGIDLANRLTRRVLDARNETLS